jgi:single-strand DNA-binding protein
MMVNKVVLIGRLGNDVDQKYIQDGTCVSTFSLATEETWKNKAGEKQSKTSWHRIIAWRRLGEICGEYLKKGSKVYIEGKIDYREYEKDGVKFHITEIIANEMKMLGDKPQGDGQSDKGKTAKKPPAGRDPDFTPEFDDDIAL